MGGLLGGGGRVGFLASTDVVTPLSATISVIANMRPVENLDRRFTFLLPVQFFRFFARMPCRSANLNWTLLCKKYYVKHIHNIILFSAVRNIFGCRRVWRRPPASTAESEMTGAGQ